MSAAASYRLGVDIGGTFTDVSLLDAGNGELHVHKVATTPADPSAAVARGVAELLDRLGAAPQAVTGFVHGTTIGVNAVIERRGARVALFVSEGNRDVLDLARLEKPDKLNLHAVLPERLVPRSRVIEIGGRVSADGAILAGLAPDAVERALAALDGADVESFAVCLLHAHVNPAHEEEIERELARLRPDVACSRSSALWPEIREYERATVAALNAYVQPIMDRYLVALEHDTAAIGLDAPVHITRSNGGVMTAAAARTAPVHTLLSGPAAGVVGAAHVARLAGIDDAITLDIGGTSADVSIVRGGEPVHSTEATVGDFPLIMPAVDVFSIGAGGGSIAWFDPFGLLKLGPRSAGADPGPACYGLGGADPTVTDAYLVCGYLNPSNFVGGTMRLDPGRARDAVGAVAARLGVGVEDAAESILRLATSNMSTALLPLMTKRGIDPRDFSLIAYGGAGATHACFLADDIRIPRIVVPPAPGTLCALGAAIADLKSDHIRTVRRRLAAMEDGEIGAALAALEREGRDWLAAQAGALDQVSVHRAADMRYAGQAFDVEVPIPQDAAARLTPAALEALFHDTYEALYKHSDPGAPVGLMNLRVRVAGKVAEPAPPRLDPARGPASDAVRDRRPVYLDGAWRDAAVFDRADLRAGHAIDGPAVIEQFDTTTVVAPGFAARVDGFGLITLSRGG